MRSVQDTMPSSKITLVDEAVIECRIRGIHKLLCNQKYNKMKKVINESIRTFQNAEEITCDRSLLSKIINILYICLIDIAMNRHERIHNHICKVVYIS